MLTRHVLEPAPFLERLADEVDRARRYERPFSLVVLRPPAGVAPDERAKLLGWAAVVVRNHVRASDLVATFEDDAILAILLPETRPEGAEVVRARFRPLDRLATRRSDASAGWAGDVFAYPEAARVIEAFLRRRARAHSHEPTPAA